MADKMVPQSGDRMQPREREERVRQIPVDILGGPVYSPVLFNPEIKIKKTEVKNAAMVNEGHDAEDGNDEHQPVKRQVHRA